MQTAGSPRLSRRGQVPAGRLLRLSAVAALAAICLAYLLAFRNHTDGSSFVRGLLGNGVLALSGLICLVRGALVRHRRAGFVLLGLVGLTYLAGSCLYGYYVQFLDPQPFPSIADIPFLATNPLMMAAVVALAWQQLRQVSLGVLLDGSLGALSSAAAGSILTVAPAAHNLYGSGLARIVTVGYPVLDLVLLALIIGIVTVKAGRLDPTWLLLIIGVLMFVAGDLVAMYLNIAGTYSAQTPLNALWGLGVAVMSLSALLPVRSDPVLPSRVETKALYGPNFFSLVGVGILVYGCLISHRLPLYATVLALATLMTAAKRAAVGFAAMKLLAVTRHEAETDALTQLPNRRFFDEVMQRMLADRDPDAKLAVLNVDLNGFKAINDTFGHHAGDEVLRQVATRFRHVLAPGDVLARLGGDEFGLLLPDSDERSAVETGRRMLAQIDQPLLIDGESHSAGASIGIAMYPDDGVDMAMLLQRADAAMFDAKRNRRGVMVYDAAEHRQERNQLNIRAALERHQLVVHYQPQFELASGRMDGVEALVRWQHPERGLLQPDAFLSHFEQAGLSGELTLEVLEIALRDRSRWQAAGRDLEVSVNLPPSALLRPDLVAAVGDLLTRYATPARQLTLEITENAMMIDVDWSRRTLEELRALGVRLSLDDYGTGYCSLTYLRDLPLHEIKIDRSFVTGLTPGSGDAAIVASTLELAAVLGLRTVAEGVETLSAFHHLRGLGGDRAQGYLFSRPVPAAELLEIPSRTWTQWPAEIRGATAPEERPVPMLAP